MRIRFGIILCLLLVFLPSSGVRAQESANARQARRIFTTAYNRVYGDQGASMHYDVNITGVYKTSGTTWYKGKRSKFTDARVTSWNDGTTIYTIRKKKKEKEVEIYSAANNKSDKYSQKFKFEPENYDYGISETAEGLLLTLKLKKGMKGMKEVNMLVERKTYDPISIRIKVAFIWTTIKISDFHSGGITDEMLRFPKEKYKDYKFVDKR